MAAGVVGQIVANHLPINGIFVEVGCDRGETTILCAPQIKHKGGQLHVVDWFCGCLQEPPSHVNGFNPANEDMIYNQFMSQMTGYHDILTVHKGISWQLAKDFADESIDICFIDACHLYGSVKADILAYLPKVKTGGILAGHDLEGWHLLDNVTDDELSRQCCPRGHVGVAKAVNEVLGKDNIQLLADSVWVYRKV